MRTFAMAFLFFLSSFLLAGLEPTSKTELVPGAAIVYMNITAPTNINGVENSSIYHMPTMYWRHAFVPNQYLKAGMGIFSDEYVWILSQNRAFPTQIESGSESGPLAMVLGLMPGVSYQFEFPINPKFNLGVSGDLDLVLRLPIIALDSSTGISAIGTYLNGSGKFIYPGLSLYSRIGVRKGIDFILGTKVQAPLAHAWDGEGLDFTDSLLTSFNISLIFNI